MTEVQYKAELVNGKPVLYHRITPQGGWDDITHTRHNLDELELYDLNLKLTNVKECETELSGLIFRIFLNFMCYHLKLGDKLLWTYYADPHHDLPIQILFNLKRNTMKLVFNGNKTKNLSMVGYSNDWVEPGKLLTRFKTRRTITDGETEVTMFGEEDPCVELERNNKIVWKYEEGAQLPVSLIKKNGELMLVFPPPRICDIIRYALKASKIFILPH
ncbi:hypothetical protein TpMuguga_02g00789 [Theileria parva strain Muguga]|uniref:Uncharacterized protein n=1 Tax=Theileria parva TaxID=5875 RepID=Q4N450_THEPA|nr:uncharacterized protein TpMuguga_02g00789 [Theileria parva strain Muguga]EAN33073.1 hypothetical protein TpMuguga_02g00789 [Theileria parva strain Muguga]|eukprot:XP_765356.1 hypothetical protein [Theileria parva strain Muguga]